MKSQLRYDDSKRKNDDVYYICPLAKDKRLLFVLYNHMSPSLFDFIHCDIWGPYHVTAQFGYRYFLTIVDDCTHFTWIFLLKQKSDVATVIPNSLIWFLLNSTTKSKVSCLTMLLS